MPFTANEIARHVDGQVQGDPEVVLTGFAPAATAQPGDLTFAENEAYLARALQSAATAILVDTDCPQPTKTLIRVAKARIAFARILPIFFPEPIFTPGIHPTAIVHPTARIHPSAHVGPFCVIGEHVAFESGVVLEGSNHIGAHCQIGQNTHLFPHVTLYPRTQLGARVRLHAGCVIGSDGYGYVLDQGAHRKIPQIGNVVIQDDVEIGANTTVDRGALGSTLIGRGTKIDNLVQIGHNVTLGEHSILVAQVGVAGSTRVGKCVTLAGQAGLAGHLTIGDRAVVAAQSGVMNNIPAGERWFGSPARPDRQAKRQFVAMEHLPDLAKRVAQLERQLAKLQQPPQGQTQ